MRKRIVPDPYSIYSIDKSIQNRAKEYKNNMDFIENKVAKGRIKEMNDYMKRLCSLNKDPDDFTMCYRKFPVVFLDFLKSKRFKKYEKQFLHANGIKIYFDNIERSYHYENIVLQYRSESSNGVYDDYSINTQYNPYNFSVFEIDYITRLSMLLMYLRDNKVKSDLVGSYFNVNKYWSFTSNIKYYSGLPKSNGKIDSMIIYKDKISCEEYPVKYYTTHYCEYLY